ncbi:CPXCG motif-containing cysteine-rich protein [Pseudoxanthomonas winnipegensis]|uniref:CPXCG motif-containing cysteine-rich protein n=1 Tax=Pseudoxanthomonas winnipegensis TaxID=2480810 RepID=UPI00103C61D2|nr:CPXCG motif-containing cysteine-rich protein [Pseudoxanthomonas winnipegensis]TBV74402.1 CPXCG motif-containing cysteine-rich protein [Pseudoxanthomonas winnipegensis]
MLDFQLIHCPYCGEPLEIAVDTSAGDADYIEDCQVCCRPIAIALRLDEEGDARIAARAENDA